MCAVRTSFLPWQKFIFGAQVSCKNEARPKYAFAAEQPVATPAREKNRVMERQLRRRHCWRTDLRAAGA